MTSDASEPDADAPTILQIACAANEAYVPHCAAMLHSLASNHEPGQVEVHFLHDSLMPSVALGRLAAYAESLGLGFRPCLVADDVDDRFPEHETFRRTTWYRVLLPEFLPDVGRILYIDCDLVVLRSLRPLFEIDLGGAVVGAVTNAMYAGTDLSFLDELGVPSIDRYFNAGVLLMDLDRWRAEGVGDEVAAFLTRGEHMLTWPDQSALNAILWNRRLALPPIWNSQNPIYDRPRDRLPFTAAQVDEAREAPAIVHFIGPYKPWHYRSKHPFRSAYFEHLAATPWSPVPIEGRTLANRILRLLPPASSYRYEAERHVFNQRARLFRERIVAGVGRRVAQRSLFLRSPES